ncbi:MAG: hypothetical protein RLY70_4800, partial [Planctomycetota bacterium]
MPTMTVNGEKLRYLAIHCRENLLGGGTDPAAVGLSVKTISNWANSKKKEEIEVAERSYRKLEKVLCALSGGEWPDASVLETGSACELASFKSKVQEFRRRASTTHPTTPPIQPAPVPTSKATPLPGPDEPPDPQPFESPDPLHRYCRWWL